MLADQVAPPAPGSPLSLREAQLKLKALNQATVKLASQLEQREAENQRLKQQLDKVHTRLNKGCGGVFVVSCYHILSKYPIFELASYRV